MNLLEFLFERLLSGKSSIYFINKYMKVLDEETEILFANTENISHFIRYLKSSFLLHFHYYAMLTDNIFYNLDLPIMLLYICVSHFFLTDDRKVFLNRTISRLGSHQKEVLRKIITVFSELEARRQGFSFTKPQNHKKKNVLAKIIYF